MCRLVDENGPRRGVDTRCSITAELVDGRRIFVEASAAWPFTAITRAAHRLNESIRRELERHAGRGRHSVWRLVSGIPENSGGRHEGAISGGRIVTQPRRC